MSNSLRCNWSRPPSRRRLHTNLQSTNNPNSPFEPSKMGLNKNPALQPILLLPILFPITSFLFYTPIASGFRTLLEVLNTDRNWIPVDGGAYQIEILTPSINGIVLPSLCILFATLVSTTITQLRDRQVSERRRRVRKTR